MRVIGAEILIKHPGKVHVRTFRELHVEPDPLVLPGGETGLVLPGDHSPVVVELVLAEHLGGTVRLLHLDVVPGVVVDVVLVALREILHSAQWVLTAEPHGGVGEGDGAVLVVRHGEGHRLLCCSVTEELLFHRQHAVLAQQRPNSSFVVVGVVVSVVTCSARSDEEMFLVRLGLTLVEITEVRPVVSALYVPLVIVILRAENTNKTCLSLETLETNLVLYSTLLAQLDNMY